MQVVLSTLQLAFISIICIFELYRKSPSVFLWGTLAAMFGLIHFLSCCISSVNYNPDVMKRASIFVILFCMVYMITRLALLLLSTKTFKRFTIRNIRRELLDSKITIILIVWIGILIRNIYVITIFSGGFFTSSWALFRAYILELGYMNISKIYKVIYFSLAGIPVITFLRKQYKLTFFLYILILISTIISRNRIEILPIFVSLLTITILSSSKIKISKVTLLILVGLSAIYCIYGIRVFRHAGSMENFFSMYSFSTFNQKIGEHILTDDGELGLRRHFYYFIENNNNFKNFGLAHTYVRMLMVYIPTRLSFGLKPSDFAVTMGEATGASIGGSIHPTLFGDCYANLGFSGVFLGAFWAAYAHVGDQIILSKKKMLDAMLIYQLYAVSNIIIARGSVYNGFILVAYGIPIIIISRIIYERKRIWNVRL